MGIFFFTEVGDDGALADVFEAGFDGGFVAGGFSFDDEFFDFGLVLRVCWDVEVDGADFVAGAFSVADEEGDEVFSEVAFGEFDVYGGVEDGGIGLVEFFDDGFRGGEGGIGGAEGTGEREAGDESEKGEEVFHGMK